MTNSEDLKALVAELRDRAGQPGRYGLRSPDLQLLVQAADALEARIAVPSGWQFVPVEPTREMIKAAGNYTGPRHVEQNYRAMLSAAPGVGGEG